MSHARGEEASRALTFWYFRVQALIKRVTEFLKEHAYSQQSPVVLCTRCILLEHHLRPFSLCNWLILQSISNLHFSVKYVLVSSLSYMIINYVKCATYHFKYQSLKFFNTDKSRNVAEFLVRVIM